MLGEELGSDADDFDGDQLRLLLLSAVTKPSAEVICAGSSESDQQSPTRCSLGEVDEEVEILKLPGFLSRTDLDEETETNRTR